MGIQLRCLSYSKLRLLVLMRNYRIITFDDQKIYKNKTSFNKAMKSLERMGFVEIRNIPMQKNECKVTDRGNDIGVALNGVVE